MPIENDTKKDTDPKSVMIRGCPAMDGGFLSFEKIENGVGIFLCPVCNRFWKIENVSHRM